MILSMWRLGDTSRVLAFTIYEPPNPPADRIERAERLVFIRDGFSFPALLFGPFWLLFNRLWAVFALYMVVAFATSVTLEWMKVVPFWTSVAGIALNFIVALEADSIRRWSLERNGYRLIGTVVGRSMAECERRFFENWLPKQPILRPRGPAGEAPDMPLAYATMAVGFIPQGHSQSAPQPAETRKRRWHLFSSKS